MTWKIPTISDERSGSTGIADAVKAVTLCLGGAVDEGIALYLQIVKFDDAAGERLSLPVGLHLKLLEGAGLNDAAGVIRREALKAGHNLSVKTVLGKPATEIVSEYRELFAKNVINSRMVADFLIQLSKLGQTAELASFLDVNRFVKRAAISISDGDTCGENFWNAIAATLLERRTNMNLQESRQSVRGMHFINRLAECPDRLIQRLLIELNSQVAQYLADVGQKGLLPWIPDEFRIDSPWALISSGYGYNTPHIHQEGWISGVVYIAGPSEMGPDGYPVGALRVGAPKAVKNMAGWPNFAVAPEPGTLVLMPSYFTHWTEPLNKPGLRISIAFDVIDLRTRQAG